MFTLADRPWDQVSQQFAQDDRVRLTDFFTPESARDFHAQIAALPPFHQACFINDQPQLITRQQFQSLSQDDRAEVLKTVAEQAARGVGYWYGRYETAETCPVKSAIESFMNSDDMLSLVKSITGDHSLTHTTVQLTRFRPGDFLTRHIDNVVAEGRRFAFVINLNPGWHPDWGGLLQFFQSDGVPRDAWSPEYNSFGLFDVRHVHSVTAITHFCPQVRHTISGWFQA